MSTHTIDQCLKEVEASKQSLVERLAALQMYSPQVTRDDTRQWFSGEISQHRDRIAMLDQLASHLKTVAATDYPALALTEMPQEVRDDVNAMNAKMSQSTETMNKAMQMLEPEKRQASPTPAAEAKPPEAPQAEVTPPEVPQVGMKPPEPPAEGPRRQQVQRGDKA